MSEAAQTPQPAPASDPKAPQQQTTTPPTGKTVGRDRARKSASEIAAKWAPKFEDGPQGEGRSEPPGAPAEKPETAKAEPAKDPGADKLAQLERQVARALADLQKSQADGLSGKRQAEELAKKLEAYEKASPLELLKLRGTDYESLTRDILAGKLKPPSPEQIAVEQAKSEVEQLKQWREQLETQQRELQERELAKREVEYVTGIVTQQAEAYPALAAIKWAPERAREIFYARAKENGQQPDLSEVLSELHTAVASDVRSVLSDERAAKAILADKAVREMVLKALGVGSTERATATPASETGAQPARGATPPRALTQDLASDAGERAARGRKRTAHERRMAALARLEAHARSSS